MKKKGRRGRKKSWGVFKLSALKKSLNEDFKPMKEVAQFTFGGEHRAFFFSERLGKLINQISERFVNAPRSYREANYRYQPALFVFRIIRLIIKLSPLETKLSLLV